MIKNLPIIYPSESTYSWLARTYSQSGIICHKYFTKEIFIHWDERIDYSFINLFNETFKKQIDSAIGFRNLLLNHTLFKYYSRFIPVKERKKVYDLGINNKELLSKRLHILSKRDNYFLRYCPCCVKEDRNKFGECYFHIEHQIYDLHICPKHNIELINTNIINNKDSDVTFVTLEQLNPTMKYSFRPKDINYKISKYIYDVFNEPIEINNKVVISDYLCSKLNRSQCVDEACTKKNIIKLTKDISSFYEDLVIKNFREHRICDIYRGKNINPYDVLLISYFHNISPSEFKKLRLNKNDIKRPIIRRVIDLYIEGIESKDISLLVGRKEDQVIRIINGYKKVKEKSRNHRYETIKT